MKKTAVFLLIIVLAFSMAACGSSAGEDVSERPDPSAEAAVSDATIPDAQAEIVEEEKTDGQPEDFRSIAEELIEQSVEELYARIGEPDSSEYASSCLIQGGQDGTLYYDGFIVYTTVYPDGGEFVYFVE